MDDQRPIRGHDDPSDDALSEALRPVDIGQDEPGHVDDSRPGSAHKDLYERFPDLSPEELDRLPVIEPGTRLEQGGVYLDLDDAERRPFKALGGHAAGRDDRYVAKRDVDHELWNRLAGDREPVVERPARDR